MTPKLGSRWKTKHTDEPDTVWTVASVDNDYKLAHMTFNERKITVGFEWFGKHGVAC